MKKLFQYLIIRLTTRHATTAATIFDTIFHPQLSQPIIIINQQSEGVIVPSSPTTKKQEVTEALKYLKAKAVKSKQDKGSISMLEGVLATM